MVLMIMAALAHAFNLHFIHGLSTQVNTFVNMHYSHMGFIATNGILCNLAPRKMEMEDVSWWLVGMLAGIVVTGFLAQLLVFMANIIQKPSKMMPFGYVSVIAGFYADLYLFGTNFDLLPIIGMILTSVGLLS